MQHSYWSVLRAENCLCFPLFDIHATERNPCIDLCVHLWFEYLSIESGLIWSTLLTCPNSSNLPIYLSVWLSVWQSVCLAVCLSVYLSMLCLILFLFRLYSILLYSILLLLYLIFCLFYSGPFCSVLFYSRLFDFVVQYCIPFYSFLFYSILSTYFSIYLSIYLPVVPHKAVAEVSSIGNL